MASARHPAIHALMSAAAVRERCGELLDLARRDELEGFSLEPQALDGVARAVARLTRQRFPDLDIPFHSRWRHFELEGADRFAPLMGGLSGTARLMSAFDLVVVSVLLDAGAGTAWRYHDVPGGQSIGRSEGLALASLDMFASGAFSSDPDRPLRADAAALRALQASTLAHGFQVSARNPLPGLEGRLALLNRLGRILDRSPQLFGSDPPRFGGLATHLLRSHDGGPIPAPAILEAVLHGLGGIWPGRSVLHGINLGDTWHHPGIVRDDESSALLPFHKLSQWLCYSLVEPLLAADVEVVDLDGLTGLAEYRNGGLLVDHGVLVPRDPAVLERAHPVDSMLVVEWRALTVALLDALLPMVRRHLGCGDAELPLVRMLEGGTWRAGRQIAAELRPDGSPPIRILSDGTVF